MFGYVWRLMRASPLLIALSFACVVTALICADVNAFATSPSCSSSYLNDGPEGHYYVGEESFSSNHQGFAGQLGSSSSESLNGATFIINWYGLNSGSTDDCNPNTFKGQCSIQGGYGQGTVSNKTAPANDHAYGEVNGVNGYLIQWSPTSYISGSVHIYAVVTGYDASVGAYAWEVYAVSPTAGTNVLISGYSANEDLQAEANTETYYANSGTCAAFNSPTVYGAYNDYSYGTETEISGSQDNGGSYHPVDGTWTTLSNSPYVFTPKDGVDAFLASGGT